MNTKYSALVVTALISCVFMQSANALIHVVGGSCGWEVPPNATFFDEWAKPRTFGVGDKLVFPYRIGAHNVIQVPKDDFDRCGHDHVMAQYYKGPTILELNSTGDYYFYSSVGTHCEMGQKLHIVVGGAPGKSGRKFKLPRRLLLTTPVLSTADTPVLAEGPALPVAPTDPSAQPEAAPPTSGASSPVSTLGFIAVCFVAMFMI